MSKMDEQIKHTLEQVSANVRLFRESRGLSREKFCEPLAVTPEYFSTIERENTDRVMNLPLLLKICSVYNVSLDYFFKDIQPQEDNTEETGQIISLLKKCDKKQLTIIHRFITEVANYI